MSDRIERKIYVWVFKLKYSDQHQTCNSTTAMYKSYSYCQNFELHMHKFSYLFQWIQIHVILKNKNKNVTIEDKRKLNHEDSTLFSLLDEN